MGGGGGHEGAVIMCWDVRYAGKERGGGGERGAERRVERGRGLDIWGRGRGINIFGWNVKGFSIFFPGF